MLEPRLTKWDLSVLKALASGEHAYAHGLTAWQIGEQMLDEDVKGLRQVLDALCDRRLAWKTASPPRLGPTRWVRSTAGDDYIKEVVA